MRTATIQDAVAIIPLVLASQIYQKKELEREQINEAELGQSTTKNVREWLVDPTFHFVVAEENKQIVGYCTVSVSKVYPASGSLHDLFIEPDYRRQGLATKMITAALDWLRGQGVKEVDLAVHKDNKAALALYYRLGWLDEPDDYRYLKKKL